MPMPKATPTISSCRVCGIEFETGGRGRPRRDQLYCSKKCSAMARVRQPKINRLRRNDLAYIAGVFDGEGSIILWDRGYGGRPQLRCTISNTYKPLMDWLVSTSGTGSVVRKVFPVETGYKDGYTWQVYGQNAVALLKQMLPCLIVKRERAIVAIESQKVKKRITD